ncbi:MAG: D-alanyl-D-alanine carboxypeptidase [Candidatus Jettenia ecosi]|uniref:D-alanyl-D-alanine carboxypeptidase n=1 Tax=Candidatus Jettenia ecosi TaxID=2494326 RepID=A0A533QGB5_9BACT|nr:MAG: D-alanyl-D-alanine carboxypeptidase [Candidatus Jettenia ecosi]
MSFFRFTVRVYPYIGIFFLIIFNIFLPGIFFATNLEANTNNLNKQIQTLLKNLDLKQVSCGISVVSLKKNVSVYNYRSNNLFSVASNMKLLTTAAALDYLGPNFTYETSIEANGVITDSGKLKGDIILKGSGDPNLSGRFYHGNILAVPESWASALRSRGISRITGDIIADDTIFDRIYTHPAWSKNQLSAWYCAPSCGLSFNDNCVDITLISSKKPGNAVILLINPDTSYFTIFNNCIGTSDKKEHAYSMYREPETNRIFITGKFWINASPKREWVTVYNPALYLATVFKEVLEKYGILVDGTARLIDKTDVADAHRERITQTTSTMGQTISVTNKRSQNFYAEQILKTLGAHVNGEGSTKSGIDILHNFMNKLGFHPDEYQIEDGSGLSRGNRFSPHMITSLLTYMYKHPHGKVLYDSLPVSGKDGGLKDRMVSPQYKNRVHAKTGYIAKVSTLSGYINTPNGDVIAFSILMNNFNNLRSIHKVQDDICRTLINYYN